MQRMIFIWHEKPVQVNVDCNRLIAAKSRTGCLLPACLATGVQSGVQRLTCGEKPDIIDKVGARDSRCDLRDSVGGRVVAGCKRLEGNKGYHLYHPNLPIG